MSKTVDFYKVLGVPEDATADALKKAYRQLARTHHPDRNPDDAQAEDRFKEIQQAYEVLGDEKKRQQYDRMRRNPLSGGGDGRSVDMNDIFEQFFGGRPGGGFDPFGGRTPQPEPDLKRTVKLSFDRMLKGGDASFTLNGDRISVPFPPGVKDGYRVRLRGKGRRLGPTVGDLYVTFRTSDEGRFRREGDDVYTTLDVDALDAVVGAVVNVVAPAGKTVKLTIPPGTQNGEKLRIRGLGIPKTKDLEGPRGDLFVDVRIVVPTNLTDAQLDAIKKVRG